jgi:hypothetical protein
MCSFWTYCNCKLADQHGKSFFQIRLIYDRQILKSHIIHITIIIFYHVNTWLATHDHQRLKCHNATKSHS